MGNILSEDTKELDLLFMQASDAMKSIYGYTLDELNHLIRSIAWSVYNDLNATSLAELAVEDTGLGNVADKVLKNKRKTLGTLNDLLKADTIGPENDRDLEGVVNFYKPIGIVVSLTPSTNPAATLVSHAMMAIKGRNPIIICPSPSGYNTAKLLEKYIHRALEVCGAPTHLFQVAQQPISFSKAEKIMARSDLCIVTGDQQNVMRGYQSGVPCIGVGKGNVPVVIDSTANLKEAASLVSASKIFDNATSCSSENSIVILEDVYDKFIEELEKYGGYLCNAEQKEQVQKRLFCENKLNRHVVCKDLSTLVDIFELEYLDANAKYLITEETGIGSDYPLSGEKMSLVLTAYKATDIDHAIKLVNEILLYEGQGHSAGIHSSSEINIQMMANKVDVARLIVNQAHTFANGGGAENSLPFTLTMGCGTWAGNSICENLSIKHFINTTRQVNKIKTERLGVEGFGEFYDSSLDV